MYYRSKIHSHYHRNTYKVIYSETHWQNQQVPVSGEVNYAQIITDRCSIN